MEFWEQEANQQFTMAYKECKQVGEEVRKTLEGFCSKDTLQNIVSKLDKEYGNLDQAYRKLTSIHQESTPDMVNLLFDHTVKDLSILRDKATSRISLWEKSSQNFINTSGLDEADHRSVTSQQSVASTTSSKKAFLMAQSAALQAERQSKREEAENKARLKSLQLEEIKCQERFKLQELAEQAKQTAERVKHDTQEKLRQVHAEEEIEKHRQDLEDQRIANELSRNQMELNVLESM